MTSTIVSSRSKWKKELMTQSAHYFIQQLHKTNSTTLSIKKKIVCVCSELYLGVPKYFNCTCCCIAMQLHCSYSCGLLVAVGWDVHIYGPWLNFIDFTQTT